MRYIIKRDNSKEKFDDCKISNAIQKALDDVGSNADAFYLTKRVVAAIKDPITVEAVQDAIEEQLVAIGEFNAARAFIHYRDQRTRIREAKSDLFRRFDQIVGKNASDVEFKRENANINADAPMGVMLKFGSESAKEYNLKNLIDPEIAELHRNGDIHIHDLDFYHTFNCVLPDTNVILHQDGERQAALGDEFRLLGLGTHKVTGTLILSRNGFVDLNYVHIRHHDGLVYEFCTKRRSLTCTAEHRLPVIRDGVEVLLKAESIKQGDRFIVSHNRCSWEDARREDDGTIISVTKTRYKGRVFDVTTGDHYFVANNIVSHNCCQIPLGKLLETGFSTGHGCIRQPKSILSAASVACIILQSNQNDMFGGQSFPMWDYDLAPYVAKSFIKHCKKVADILENRLDPEFEKNCEDYYNKNKTLIEAKEFLKTQGLSDKAYAKALSLTDEETHQAMQAMIHNLNTMNCLTADMPVETLDLSSAVNLRRMSETELDALTRLLSSQYKTMTVDELAVEHKTTKAVMHKILVNLGIKLHDKKGVAEVNKRIFQERYGYDNCMKNPDVQSKVKATQFEKYGKYAFNTEKQRQPNVERYGYPVATMNPDVVAKAQATTLKHYGVKCSLQHPDVKAKSVATCLAKYGVRNAGAAPEVIAKREQTCMDHLGVPNPFVSEEIRNKGLRSCLERYGYERPGLARCGGRSKAEDVAVSMIEDAFPDLVIMKNIRGLLPSHRLHEIDILLPELDIGFEVNGAYSHDKAAYDRGDMTKERIKEQAATQVGISLYQIWEEDLYTDRGATAHQIATIIEEAIDE